MSLKAACLVVVLAVSGAAAADKCGCTAKPVTGFKAAEYLGVWYQIAVSEVFEEIIERKFPDCVMANYSLNAEGNIKVVNSGGNSQGERNKAVGTAVQPEAGVGALTVTFGPAPPSGPPNYEILQLQNDAAGKYAVSLVWSCGGSSILAQSLWVLARTPTIPAEQLSKAVDFARAANIDVDRLKLLRTNQTHCTY